MENPGSSLYFMTFHYNADFSPVFIHPPPSTQITEGLFEGESLTIPADVTDADGDAVRIIIDRKDLEEAGYEHNKKAWSEEEDRNLLYLKEELRLDWEDIS